MKRYVSLFHNVIIPIDSGRVTESFNQLMIRRTFQARTNLPGLPSLIQSSFIRLHFVPVTHSIKQPSETGICQNFRFSSVQCSLKIGWTQFAHHVITWKFNIKQRNPLKNNFNISILGTCKPFQTLFNSFS